MSGDKINIEQELSTVLASYRPSEATVALVQQTPIVLLVGISGAGKGSVRHRLITNDDYHEIVSHTTRQPRKNDGVMEQDGHEYHFISRERALEMLKQGAFVEAKMYSNNVYGTSVAEIQTAQQQQKIALTDLEVQGVAEYKAISPHIIALFIVPPSYDVWQQRLRERYGSEGVDEADLAKRMEASIIELEEALSKPYYHFILNDDLDRAVDAANSIAHNHDTYTLKDDEARQQAKTLLEEIRARIA